MSYLKLVALVLVVGVPGFGLGRDGLGSEATAGLLRFRTGVVAGSEVGLGDKTSGGLASTSVAPKVPEGWEAWVAVAVGAN